MTQQIKIQYDTPIEVSAAAYNYLMDDCKGIVAGKIKDGKYFIKVWLMKYAKHIEKIIATR